MTFGRLLQTLREERQLTQQQLSEMSGVALGTLRNHEQGTRLPSLPHAAALAHALGVPLDRFAGCEDVTLAAVANDGKKGARG